MSPLETNHNHTAAGLGAIRNSLGILSDDHRRIRPRALRNVTRLSPTRLSEILHVQRSNVYRDEIPIPKAIHEKVIHLVLVTDLGLSAYE